MRDSQGDRLGALEVLVQCTGLPPDGPAASLPRLWVSACQAAGGTLQEMLPSVANVTDCRRACALC